jgi:hypothetical protein
MADTRLFVARSTRRRRCSAMRRICRRCASISISTRVGHQNQACKSELDVTDVDRSAGVFYMPPTRC